MNNTQKTQHIDLTICIVNWNTRDILRKCLQSIYTYSEDLAIEIIIVDNASTDGTVGQFKSEYPDVLIIENKNNIGFGRANNQAIHQSRGKYILLLNPDIILIEPCLTEMINFLKNHSKVGCVGTKLINTDNRIQKSYFKTFPTPFNQFKEGMLLNRLKNIISPKDKDTQNRFEVAWLVGACMMFKSELLKTLRGFDEQYFMFGEDVDLCYQLKKIGFKIYYLNDIKMLHHHAVSSKQQVKRYFSAVLQKESRYKFMKKNYGNSKAVFFRLGWFFSGLMRVILLIPTLFLSFIIRMKKATTIFFITEKYTRIITWALGFEKWVYQEIPK